MNPFSPACSAWPPSCRGTPPLTAPRARPILRAAVVCLFAIAAGAAAGQAAPAEAGADVLARCWTPAQLASRPEERFIHRGERAAQTPFRLEAFTPGAPAPERLRGSIRRVRLPAGARLVALTFDLCEAAGEVAGYDGAIIDHLRANRVPATFFAGGKWLVSHPERAAQLLADPLFSVGSHGWSHANLRVVKGEAMIQEIHQAGAAWQAARASLAGRACLRGAPASPRPGAAPTLFRFPYGVCNPESLAAVSDAGMLAIQWDVVTGDPFRGASAEAIAREVLRTTKPGSIIVAHANGRGWNTAAALPLFIPALRARGFRFVTVDELLAAGEPEIVADCYELKPGDNARYDAKGRQGGTPARPGFVPGEILVGYETAEDRERALEDIRAAAAPLTVRGEPLAGVEASVIGERALRLQLRFPARPAGAPAPGHDEALAALQDVAAQIKARDARVRYAHPNWIGTVAPPAPPTPSGGAQP